MIFNKQNKPKVTEQEFLKKLNPVWDAYLENCEMQPGYIYSNKEEFRILAEEGTSLKTKNKDIIRKMNKLQKDIKISEKSKKKPLRSSFEQIFYDKVSKVYQTRYFSKKFYKDLLDKDWLFKDEDQLHELLKLKESYDIKDKNSLFMLAELQNDFQTHYEEVQRNLQSLDLCKITYREETETIDEIPYKVTVTPIQYVLVDENNIIYKAVKLEHLEALGIRHGEDMEDLYIKYGNSKLQELVGQSLDNLEATLTNFKAVKVNDLENEQTKTR